jgi:cyclopropane fatty-acyl-phospholipid synthase-like methyltransferase
MSTLPYSSATERNRQPILDQLTDLLPETGSVLEIGSGTGQHAVFITRHLTGIRWQPTDRAENLAGLDLQFAAKGNPRINKPLKLDVMKDPWPEGMYEAVFSANTAHIMPWEAVQAMFAGVARHLLPGARFCLYGPFNIDNAYTSPGNEQFDARLRAQDPQMGIRDVSDLESLSDSYQMFLNQKIAMPANNFILVFNKKSDN